MTRSNVLCSLITMETVVIILHSTVRVKVWMFGHSFNDCLLILYLQTLM